MRTAAVCGWMAVEFLNIFLMKKYLIKRLPQVQERWNSMETKENPGIETAIFGFLTIAAGICGLVSYTDVAFALDSIKLLAAYVGLSMAAYIDYKVWLIPNVIAAGMGGFRLLLFLPEFLLQRGKYAALNSVAGAVLTFGTLFLLSVVSRGGLGMGDVKLLTALGFLCGLYVVLNVLIGALFLCVLAAMGLILAKKKKAKDKLAFGPFLFLGFLIAIFLGAY